MPAPVRGAPRPPDVAAGHVLPPDGRNDQSVRAARHPPGRSSGRAVRLSRLRLPLRVPVPVRAGVPVGVRSRVPPGPSRDPARRPGAPHGADQRAGRLPPLGRDGDVVRARPGGPRAPRGFLGGVRRDLRRLEPVVARRGRGGRAARAHGAGRRDPARRSVQHRVPDVHRVADGAQRRRGVRSGGHAVQLPMVSHHRGVAYAAVSGNRPALVLGARRPRAARARSGARIAGAAADARVAARHRGGRAGGRSGMAAGQPLGTDTGRGRRGPGGAVAGRGLGVAAAGRRRPRATAGPPRCVALSRHRRPATGAG